MMQLQEYLHNCSVDEELKKVVLAFANAGKRISEAIQTAPCGKTGTKNIYGEEQLALDIIADRIVQEEMKSSQAVGLLASEELDKELFIDKNFPYAVCFDPLDGSSLFDANLSVGTIFGIYRSDHFIGLTGDDQVASGFFLYGPKTTMMLTLRDGVREFLLDQKSGIFHLSNDALKVSEEGKMFAPGNLRATKFRQDYVDLMNFWMREQYTLRYSGGMVADINQILIKGKGIFTYPSYEEALDGKLRLLVECNPMALLMEQACGYAQDGVNRILEKEIISLSQRTPIYIGSKREVERVVEFLH
ncbi:fructose-1,6-bisphosphatase [Candidatus Peregrinibacteria bacterium]|nr:fructose-1,6-bisphosphatase [Candidatus Peregrinibacteria bacterium]